jgi:thiol-disulfide isomerase/thioredoxin
MRQRAKAQGQNCSIGDTIMRLIKSLSVFILFLSLGNFVQAADKKPFTQDLFSASQAADESMVVYVFAPWCTTCKQQESIIDKIMHNSRFDKVRYYVVDFDNDKDSMRKLKANTRSTILIYKGKQEITRSANDTDPVSIQNLLEKAL